MKQILTSVTFSYSRRKIYPGVDRNIFIDTSANCVKLVVVNFGGTWNAGYSEAECGQKMLPLADCSCTTLVFLQTQAPCLYRKNPEPRAGEVWTVHPRPLASGMLPVHVSRSLFGNLQPVDIRWMANMLGCMLTHFRTADLESCWGVGVRVLWLIFQHATKKAADGSGKWCSQSTVRVLFRVLPSSAFL